MTHGSQEFLRRRRKTREVRDERYFPLLRKGERIARQGIETGVGGRDAAPAAVRHGAHDGVAGSVLVAVAKALDGRARTGFERGPGRLETGQRRQERRENQSNDRAAHSLGMLLDALSFSKSLYDSLCEDKKKSLAANPWRRQAGCSRSLGGNNAMGRQCLPKVLSAAGPLDLKLSDLALSVLLE
jgi:hypothetical protein